MSDKRLAGVITAAAIVPLCTLCILGPALIASFFTGITAWFGGLDLLVTTALAVVAGVVVYGFIRKRDTRRALSKPIGEAPR